jgi:hypothetical protein
MPVYLSCPDCGGEPVKFTWWSTIGLALAIRQAMYDDHGIPKTVRGFFKCWSATRDTYRQMKRRAT